MNDGEAALQDRVRLHMEWLHDSNRGTVLHLIEESHRRAQLPGVDLSEAWLDVSDLSGANLAGAWMVRTHMHEVRLVGADLSRARLIKAEAVGADLSGAVLVGSDLTRMSLMRAVLVGTDLSRSYLCRTDFEDADLSGASLRDADLSLTYVHGTRFDGCDLKGAKGSMVHGSAVVAEAGVERVVEGEDLVAWMRSQGAEVTLFQHPRDIAELHHQPWRWPLPATRPPNP